MKKFLMNAALAALLSLPVCAMAAESGDGLNKNPVEVLTGEIWQQTSPENKLAWLFGIDTVVDVEKAVNAKMQPQAKKGAKIPLSPFVKNWIAAFDNTKRTKIVEQVDQWYAANPGQLNRPVMETIWYEMIEPRTKAK